MRFASAARSIVVASLGALACGCAGGSEVTDSSAIADAGAHDVASSTADAGAHDIASATADTNAPADAMFSAGCQNSAAVTTGLSSLTMKIDGVDRTYQVQVPTSYQAGSPLALVFVFHGNGGSGTGSIGFGLQNAPGASDGAIYVFPDGLQFMSYGVGWDETCGSYDLRWMQQIITSLESTYCIDPHRRFAAGFSWGGDMVNALSCCLGPTFRAVANASGGELWNQSCPNLERPALRITYADNDAYPQSGFDQVLGFFRDAQSCTNSSSATPPSPCRAWDGCTKPVIECRYPGLGHSFPANWAADTWEFFSTFK